MPNRLLKGERMRILVILILVSNPLMTAYSAFYALPQEARVRASESAKEALARVAEGCAQRKESVRLLNEERIGQIKLWTVPLRHADQSDPAVIAFKQTLMHYFGTPIPPPVC